MTPTYRSYDYARPESAVERGVVSDSNGNLIGEWIAYRPIDDEERKQIQHRILNGEKRVVVPFHKGVVRCQI